MPHTPSTPIPLTPILLTPGPLTTAPETRQAMLRDWGSWDDDFRALTRRVTDRLLAISGAGDTHVCVPLQGSGTFAVEAAIGTLVPRDGRLLVPVNGAYGRRIVQMTQQMGRAVTVHETAENAVPDPAEIDRLLAADPALSHVAVVQCETSTGILNPAAAIAAGAPVPRATAPKKAKARSWASNTLVRWSGLARMKRAGGTFQADQGP